MPTCPNDDAELKEGLFTSNRPFTAEAVEFINTFTKNKAIGYCEKCGMPLLDQARRVANSQATRLNSTLNQYIHYIPLLSLQAPTAWEVVPLGLVTGQSVTGTGVFSEFASAWTDFFGAQANAYNQKIAVGEKICQTQLRLKCVEMGGNAILATNIDYAELSGLNGMLMVCMTGTAVLLKNTAIMGVDVVEGLNIITETAKNRLAMRRFAGIIHNTASHSITAAIGK